MQEHEIYALIGEEGFRQLVHRFYSQVPSNEVLGPMYPQDDLAGAEKRLADFLIFRFGGPQTYIQERGHPRLRMRHAPFAVDQAARQHWLRMMSIALRETAIAPEAKELLWQFFEGTAAAMVNRA